VVQVCGPLAFVVHELVVEQAAGLVALLLGADHGHHRFVALLAGLSAILKQKKIKIQISNLSSFCLAWIIQYVLDLNNNSRLMSPVAFYVPSYK